MSSAATEQTGTHHGLSFVGASGGQSSVSDQSREIALFDVLWRASYSHHADHTPVSGSIVELFHKALEVTRSLASHLPLDDPEVSEFWEDMAPHFAMTVVGPMLVNVRVIQAAVAKYKPGHLVVREARPVLAGWRGLPSLYEQVRTSAPAYPVASNVPQLAGLLLRRPATAAVAAVTGGLKYARAARDIQESPAPPVVDHADLLFAAFGAAGPALLAHLLPRLVREHSVSHAVWDTRLGGSTERVHQLGLESNHWGYRLRSAHLHGVTAEVAAADRVARAVRLPEGVVWGDMAPQRTVLERLLQSMVRRWLPVYRLWNRAAQQTLDHLQPRCVLACDFHLPILTPLIRQARKRGIVCVFLQHGITSEYYLQSQWLMPYDHFLVYGRYAVEAMRPCLPPCSRIWPVGNCLADAGVQLNREPRGHSDSCPVVLAAPQWWGGTDDDRHDETWVRGVCEAAQRLGGEVWIRPHPRDEQTDRWERMSATWAHVKVIPYESRGLHETIAEADVVATRCSTVALDALARDKPVMTIDLTGEQERYPYAGDGGTAGVERYEDLEPTLRSLLETDADQLAPARNRFLDRHTGQRDGRATDRVLSILAAATGGQEIV